MFFQSLRVSTRIQSLVGLMLLGLLVISVNALLHLKETLLEDRKEKTRNIVELGVGVLTHFHKQAKDGKLSDEEARIAARETLRGLRYGSNDYYFIFDTGHVYVLLPPKVEFEGQNKADMKDANGKFLIRELVKAAQNGGGYVDYWFPKGGKTEAEPKLSYASLFTPWNWVIGTGIYISDVDEHYRKSALQLAGITVVLVLMLSAIGWSIGTSILRQLGGEPAVAAAVMQQVAAGDLTAQLERPPANSLLSDLATMVTTLRKLVSEINDGANNLVGNASAIRNTAERISDAAARQFDATTSMAAGIEQLTVSSDSISSSAQDTEKDSHAAIALASEGSRRVVDATTAIQTVASSVTDASVRIKALEDRASQISSIANVIKEIADQTNLLALNAAIEAARAGEQGRGFAVVADEVRKLAERTSLATAEIEQMISSIQQDTVASVKAMNVVLPRVEEGIRLASTATESLRSIETGAGRSLEHIADVANATREQSVASTLIAQRVEQLSQMVEETTATIRTTADTARHLEQIAHGLKSQISRFRL